MKKYKVKFMGGESREKSGVAVDYMMVEVEGEELYAEIEAAESETENYEALKDEILDQAKAAGIDTESLSFWYDEN